METKPKTITRVLFDGQSFPIDASSKKKTIFPEKNTAWFSSDFKKFGLDKYSQSTKEINTIVYEMTASGTFFEIFSGANQDFKKLVFTMAQIVLFCENYPDKLCRGGFGTFFLTKKELNIFQKICKFIFNKKTEYFVVFTGVYSIGLLVGVDRLEFNGRWNGTHHHRVVLPK